VSFLLALAQAYLITGTLDRKNSKIDFSQTKISINYGEYNGLVDNTGKFQIVVPYPGLYLLEVSNLMVHFEPVVVEVLEEEFAPNKNIKAYFFSLKSGKD